MPGRSMNVFTEEVMLGLCQSREWRATTPVKGAVITSGKDDFSAGADIEMLLRRRKGRTPRS